ncbi:ribokinase-like domain-containing protein [Paraburkholderia hospita]|jgi:5-dehydro-2-deoxygluconokinase|uniref:Ribokinase-like domain-containing protein n=1 Tax=Paraburkholderia hospita TaxID=169430 RepID=A0ABN0F6I2_9BURK|nr:5-dehydro-2-deoxygluconokinase [Paraburkholderia hospita]EUC17471.1 5-dehydro-2-deoxygluconokinase [Burkholderia sp. BT03]SKC72369.1 5-dehydro-2-deoxygluconokinase [Burkholderia sp. CF099]EIM94201.1 ribokinase-like domain-containing protein [Paraburkholderia hospita]OUL83574.1 5-dehydro-2-deoxygluconokinase [Paraburkholderia hospita]OUL94575.1 5-dehydro-2-deoxygluconokinase [Paraburkholderia hospita]
MALTSKPTTQNASRFAAGRSRDIICLGRLAVDLYAQQVGSRLEDVASFAKYLGGSSANIAFGCARLGLNASMLARVGNDHMGRFLTETLTKEGCDVSHVRTDHERLTALVLLGLKDRDTFPLIFYRENCADMAVDEADFDEAYIASSKALLITGTHFSTEQVNRTSRRALEYARSNDVRTVLDIDYRPVLWGLTGKADGETRFVANESVSAHIQGILPLFDLVIGTEEEFRIAGGKDSLIECLREVRKVTPATLVVKRGPLGCQIIDGDVPASIDDAPIQGGVEVEVLNVLGAGDAFASGFLSGWLRDEPLDACARAANASGALVVSRHGCAPAMPTPAELDYFLSEAKADPARMRRPDRDATLARLHRVTPARKTYDEVLGFAFDHRNQFFELAQQTGADLSRISKLKSLFVEAVAQTEQALGLQGKTAVLIDDRYGQDALNAATGRNWWIGRPVELPGSVPLVFDHGRSIGTTLASWPREHVVKCLVQFHPDEPIEQRIEQEAQLRALYDAVQESGHELLLEVIPPKSLPGGPDIVHRALKRIYNIGIYPEWWKLEPMDAAQWQAVDALIEERDPYCRGVVLLGLSAPVEQMIEGFRAAAQSKTCKGFTVGRTIHYEASQAWLAGQIDDDEVIARVRRTFETLIRSWRESRGTAHGAGSHTIRQEQAA